MEEDGIIDELAYWLLEILKIEERIDECKTKHLGVEKSIDLASIFAWHYAIRRNALQ